MQHSKCLKKKKKKDGLEAFTNRPLYSLLIQRRAARSELHGQAFSPALFYKVGRAGLDAGREGGGSVRRNGIAGRRGDRRAGQRARPRARTAAGGRGRGHCWEPQHRAPLTAANQTHFGLPGVGEGVRTELTSCPSAWRRHRARPGPSWAGAPSPPRTPAAGPGSPGERGRPGSRAGPQPRPRAPPRAPRWPPR